MAFTVRSLLPKVQVFRKDLEEERSIFAIQEIVRKICRQTEYASTIVSVNCVAGNPKVDLTTVMSALGNVYRLTLVRLFDTKMVPLVNATDLVAATQYKIVTPGTTNFTLVGASDSLVGTVFTASGAGTGTGTATLSANNATLAGYKMLYEYNQNAIDNGEAYRNFAQGWPSGWTYIGQNIMQIYPTPDIAYNFEVTASYIPTGEIDVIPLPEEAEEAIVAGALAFILMQPGAGQNISLAKDREVLHNREMDFLKANAILGQSGRPRATGRTLATRAIRAYDNRWQ